MKRSCQQHTDHIRNPPFFHQKRQCDTKQHTHGKSLPESGNQIDIDQDRKGQKESCRLPSDKPVQESMKQQHFGQSQHCNHNLERQSCRLKRPAKQPPANLRIKSTDISFGQVDHRRDRLIDCLIGRIIRALSEGAGTRMPSSVTSSFHTALYCAPATGIPPHLQLPVSEIILNTDS